MEKKKNHIDGKCGHTTSHLDGCGPCEREAENVARRHSDGEKVCYAVSESVCLAAPWASCSRGA